MAKATDRVMIKVENVSKSFKIPHEKNTTLKSSIASTLRLGGSSYSLFQALSDINFEVKEGEFFGIIGRNGSGKSTLLKILATIYQPEIGKVSIDGRVSPFLELGVGFNPELTAKENVFLNGAILGLTKKEISDKFESIIEFAELEDFVDMKLKNFSSGMQVRLAFSVAIQAQAEILLIDEVLAVGDANFQEKCFRTFKKMKSEGRTIVFVSHDMDSIREFCDRAALIHNSKIEVIGSVDKAVQRYNEINFGDAKNESGILEVGSTRWGNGDVKITKAAVLNGSGAQQTTFVTGDDLTLEVKYSVNKKIDKPNIGVSIFREDGIYCFDINTDLDKVSPKALEKDGVVTLSFKNMMLQKGNYYFKIGFYKDYWKETLDFIDLGPEFKIKDSEKKQHGLVFIEHDWKIK